MRLGQRLRRHRAGHDARPPLEQLGHPLHRRADHRRAGGQRLQRGDRHALPVGGEDQQVGVGDDLRRVEPQAGEAHPVRSAPARRARPPGARAAGRRRRSRSARPGARVRAARPPRAAARGSSAPPAARRRPPAGRRRRAARPPARAWRWAPSGRATAATLRISRSRAGGKPRSRSPATRSPDTQATASAARRIRAAAPYSSFSTPWKVATTGGRRGPRAARAARPATAVMRTLCAWTTRRAPGPQRGGEARRALGHAERGAPALGQHQPLDPQPPQLVVERARGARHRHRVTARRHALGEREHEPLGAADAHAHARQPHPHRRRSAA